MKGLLETFDDLINEAREAIAGCQSSELELAGLKCREDCKSCADLLYEYDKWDARYASAVNNLDKLGYTDTVPKLFL